MNKKLLVVVLVAISLVQGLKAVNPNDLPQGNSNAQSGTQGNNEHTNRAGRTANPTERFRILGRNSIEQRSGRGSSSESGVGRYLERQNRDNNNNNNNNSEN